jgi:hypothetical protein
MAKSFFWILVLLLTAGAPTSAFAQTDCGTYANYNTSHQYGDNNWLEYIVETRRKVDLFCALFSSVGVDAYVVGVAGSAASHWDTYTASVRRQIPVPDYGTWRTTGNHWRSWLGIAYSNGSTSSAADVRPKSAAREEANCDQYNGGGNYYVWDGYSCVECPIVIDTARNGYHLTSPAEGVLFDMNADGRPERVAWTRPDSDDGFLAMDRNGNGRIDDGSELFGNSTPAFPDRRDITTVNGFEALRFLQNGSYGTSTLDRQIDARDTAFGRLRLWRDTNHNGLSEPEELTPLNGAVAAIATEYKEKKRIDQFGNLFRQQGTITWADGGQGIVYDVWLRREQ